MWYLYNGLLFIYFLFSIPKMFFARLQGKRHPAFLKRLGFFWPNFSKEKVIWIHGVSVGEIKAGSTLFKILQKQWPSAKFVITTTTETGQIQAKKLYPTADLITYLPLDFSWVVKKVINRINPHLFLLIENDIWPNLLSHIKKKEGKIVVVSGKVSQKTHLRLKKIPFLAKHLYSFIDLFCMQNTEYKDRLQEFVSQNKIKVTGNIKFDLTASPVKKIDLPTNREYLTISCTHYPEEKWILEILVHTSYTFFLAPRHPERFLEVEKLLKQKNFSFILFSDLLKGKKIGEEKVIFVDVMGELATCYAQSFASILGGSFIPHIGGHNLLEPCLYRCPVIFGPYVFAQQEIKKYILEAKAGLETSFKHLSQSIEYLRENRENFAQNAYILTERLQGCSSRSFEEIQAFLQKY